MESNEKIQISDWLHSAFWTGWRLWLAWIICIATVVLLGILRKTTDAEFSFASFGLLPVLVIAWINGNRSGQFMAFLATAAWTIGDFEAHRQFSTPWIPWVNAITRLLTYALVSFLTDKVHTQLEKEHEHASHDALTGLLNRRAFLEAGTSEFELLKRYAHPVAVVFLDLDNFKQLNDTQGHDAGDAALQATAKAIHQASRATDLTARLGGDEFAILLPEIDYAAAIKTGRKIFEAVNKALKKFPPAKASLGIAWFEQVDRPFLEMLKEADALMYEVKKSRKKQPFIKTLCNNESTRAGRIATQAHWAFTHTPSDRLSILKWREQPIGTFILQPRRQS